MKIKCYYNPARKRDTYENSLEGARELNTTFSAYRGMRDDPYG